MMKNLRETVSNFTRDDLLETLGLERRPTPAEKIVPALAVFGAGVLVGVGLGLIFAPKPGAELRGDIQARLKRVEQRVTGNGMAEAREPSMVSNSTSART